MWLEVILLDNADRIFPSIQKILLEYWNTALKYHILTDENARDNFLAYILPYKPSEAL